VAKRAGAILAAAAGAAYPLLVYLAVGRLEARALGAGALVVLAAALAWSGRRGAPLARLAVRRFGVAFALAGLATATDRAVFLLLVPTAMHVALLATFAASLRPGRRPIVEEFARAVQRRFPEFLAPYCRRLTAVWCGFFAGNAVLTAALAAAAPLEWWALYCGGVFYVLFGMLMGGEYVFRKGWFRYYEEGWTDRAWARVFPAERTANGRRSLAWQASHGAAPADRP
jgi:uncharacterized membrane protein